MKSPAPCSNCGWCALTATSSLQLKKKAKELPSFKLSAADFIMEQVMGEEFETDDDMRDIEADDIKSEDSSISDSNELAQQ